MTEQEVFLEDAALQLDFIVVPLVPHWLGADTFWPEDGTVGKVVRSPKLKGLTLWEA